MANGNQQKGLLGDLREVAGPQRLEGLLGRVEPLEAASMATMPIPIVGDVAGLLADAQMFAQEPEARTPLNAGLSAMGLLPFVPSSSAVRRIMDAIRKDEDLSDFGLRVERSQKRQVGEKLPRSGRFEFDEETRDDFPTGEELPGTSSMGIGSSLDVTENKIRQGIIDMMRATGPDEEVSLIRGVDVGPGEDVGERLIDDAEVIDIFKGEDLISE